MTLGLSAPAASPPHFTTAYPLHCLAPSFQNPLLPGPTLAPQALPHCPRPLPWLTSPTHLICLDQAPIPQMASLPNPPPQCL